MYDTQQGYHLSKGHSAHHGWSERYAQNIIAAIKKWRGKQKHHLVTYGEFCEFMRIDPDELVAHWTTHSDQ